jgi:protocatechuate 3,4-dioxygenase beta subunit
MSFPVILPLFAVLAAASSTAQNPVTENSVAEKSTFTVQGRVLQDPGGQPIRKVDVSLTPRDGQPSDQYTATTDPEGKFEIPGVKLGHYRVVLQHTGFLSPGSRMGAPLVLTSASDGRDLVFHMRTAATISGKVVDSDGDPMANVSVQAVRVGSGGARFSRDQGYGNTNDLGEYRIGNLRAGKYLLSASALGQRPPKGNGSDPGKATLSYVPTYYPGTVDKTQAVPIEVHAGEETPVSLTPLTSPTFSIRGTVAKPAGANLSQVMLRASDNGDVQPGSNTREDGSFDFHDLLPGSYTAYLMVVDLASFMANGEQNHAPQAQVVRLSPPIVVTNANVEGLHLVPENPGHVRGLFRMDKEHKMDWSQLGVTLTPVDSTDFASGNLAGGLTMARVQNDGSFDLPKVAAGQYRLAITSNSNVLADYYTRFVNLDGKDVADSGFTVNGGTYSLEVIVSAEGATIEGTVVDAKGKPVTDATVVAAPDGERRKRFDMFGQDKSDAQGHFRLRGLIAGEYTALAFEDPEDNVRDPEFVETWQDRGERVQLEDGARKSVTVKVITASDEGSQ